jgi:hypothetical protein
VVADGRGVVAEQVHALEVGLGILQVALGHAGVHVAAVEQQHLAAGGLDLGAHLVDQRLARGQTVLAVAVGPEAAVMIVRVQHGQLERRSRRGCGATHRQQGGGQQGQGRLHLQGLLGNDGRHDAKAGTKACRKRAARSLAA